MINEFTTFTRYKVNIQKSPVFLYSSNKHMNTKNKNIRQLATIQKKMKYLVLTFREHCYILVTVTLKDSGGTIHFYCLLVISMGENNFSALCMLLIRATFLLCWSFQYSVTWLAVHSISVLTYLGNGGGLYCQLICRILKRPN